MVIKGDGIEAVEVLCTVRAGSQYEGSQDFLTLEAIPEDLNSTVSNLILWVRALALIQMQIPLGQKMS